jgi:biopolymer transport protein ExbD
MTIKYIGIILVVLVIAFIVSFPIVSCKQVALETATTAAVSTAAQKQPW